MSGLDSVLHLHRLNRQEQVTCLNLIAGLHVDLSNNARHWTLHVVLVGSRDILRLLNQREFLDPLKIN